MKWIIGIFMVGIIYMIATGNMGGAKNATQNYANVMYSGKNSSNKDAKPAIMHQYIMNKEKK